MNNLTESQRTILAALVLDWLTLCQYGDWPGDDAVRERVELYGMLAPGDAENVTMEKIKARARDRWK